MAKKVTGFKVIEDEKYYFNKNGVMQTGLKKINGKKYCMATATDQNSSLQLL